MSENNVMSDFSYVRFFLKHKRMIDILCEFTVVFVLFMFVYGAMMPRFGYHWDETLDFSGGGMSTYFANGRWGLALWKHLLGYGPGAWTAGILAGVFISGAVLFQTRLLQLSGAFLRFMYVALWMALPQFAYAMSYSMQSDAVAFGIFATSLAAFFTTKQGWKYFVAAIGLMTVTVGIYQSLALNYAVLIVFLVLLRIIKEKCGWVGLMFKGVIISICSLILWYIINKLCICYADISPGVKEWVIDAQGTMSNHGGITGVYELLLYLCHYGKVVMLNALSPQSYPGELLYASVIIPVAVLGYRVLRGKKMNMVKRLFAFGLVLFIWCSPFLMILAMGNEWPCRPHTRLAESLAFAGIWTIALSGMRIASICRNIILLTCGLLLIRSGMNVTHYAAEERALFEADLYKLLRMEYDACSLASEAGIPLAKGSILYFRKQRSAGGTVKYSCVDFRGSYPALRYMRYGYLPEEIAEHAPELKNMPSWPSKGSIRIHNGKVIVCGDTM